jgi:hypothetical protein
VSGEETNEFEATVGVPPTRRVGEDENELRSTLMPVCDHTSSGEETNDESLAEKATLKDSMMSELRWRFSDTGELVKVDSENSTTSVGLVGEAGTRADVMREELRADDLTLMLTPPPTVTGAVIEEFETVSAAAESVSLMAWTVIPEEVKEPPSILKDPFTTHEAGPETMESENATDAPVATVMVPFAVTVGAVMTPPSLALLRMSPEPASCELAVMRVESVTGDVLPLSPTVMRESAKLLRVTIGLEPAIFSGELEKDESVIVAALFKNNVVGALDKDELISV